MKNNLIAVKKLISVKRNKSIVITGISTLFIKLVTIGISFITIPMTLNYLGNERYGILLTLTTALSLMTFADFGLGNNLINEVSKGYAENDELYLKKSISSTYFFVLFISLLFILLVVLLLPFLREIIISKINTKIDHTEVFNTFLVIIFSILCNMPLGVVQKVYDGFQESYVYQVFLFFSSILSISVLLLFINLKLGLPFLALAFSSTSIIANIFAGGYLFLLKKTNIRPQFKYFDYSHGLVSIKVGFIFILLQLFSFINLSTDSLIIQNYSEISNVTAFELVKKLFSISSIFIFFISPMWPAFSEALHKGDVLWAKNAFYNSMKFLIGIGAIFLLPLIFFGKVIFRLWIGPGYEPSLIILIGFYLFSLIGLFGGIVSSLFNSSIFLKRQLLVVSIASISTLVSKIFLMKYFGVDYIIWANVICFVLFFVYPSIVEVKKYFTSKETTSIFY